MTSKQQKLSKYKTQHKHFELTN